MLTRALELSWRRGRRRLRKEATRRGFVPVRGLLRQGHLALAPGAGQPGVERRDSLAQAVVKVLLAKPLDECRANLDARRARQRLGVTARGQHLDLRLLARDQDEDTLSSRPTRQPGRNLIDGLSIERLDGLDQHRHADGSLDLRK